MTQHSYTGTTTRSEKWLRCNGWQLQKLANAGLVWLEQNHQYVNSLNVFPVPDGDTGTNMLLTMRSAVARAAECEKNHVGEVSAAISQGALMGARGNSGVILSQIWRGLAKGLRDKEIFDAHDLAEAFQMASDTAYNGVMRPVEGTILTVIREGAEEAKAAAKESRESRHWISCHMEMYEYFGGVPAATPSFSWRSCANWHPLLWRLVNPGIRKLGKKPAESGKSGPRLQRSARHRRRSLRPGRQWFELMIRHVIRQFTGQESDDLVGRVIEGLHDHISPGYNWPGNIRQLTNTIERAIILEEDDVIGPDSISIPNFHQPTIPPGSTEPLIAHEKELILRALKDNLWVQKNAAKRLGISPRALNYKIKKFSITHPNWRKNR